METLVKVVTSQTIYKDVDVTIEQMEFFGYREAKDKDLDTTDPATQKQLLKGMRAFICKRCKEMTWVKLGTKQVDFQKDNIHIHVTSSHMSKDDEDYVYTEEDKKIDLNWWGA